MHHLLFFLSTRCSKSLELPSMTLEETEETHSKKEPAINLIFQNLKLQCCRVNDCSTASERGECLAHHLPFLFWGKGGVPQKVATRNCLFHKISEILTTQRHCFGLGTKCNQSCPRGTKGSAGVATDTKGAKRCPKR